MPDSEAKLPWNDAEWERLVADVESRHDAIELALLDLKGAMDRLKAYRPVTAQAEDGPAFAGAVLSPPQPAESPKDAAPEATAPAPEDDDEARRQEVARLVAEMRSPAAEPVEPEEAPTEPSASVDDGASVGVPYWPGPAGSESTRREPEVEIPGYDSTNEGSWPIAQPAAEVEPTAYDNQPQAYETPDEPHSDDGEARREEVARLVAQMRAGVPVEDQAPFDDDETQDRGAWSPDMSAVADASQDESTAGQEDDDEARREEVARMVAELRAQAQTGQVWDDEDPADLVRHGEDVAPEDATTNGHDNDVDVRDEVRRAVESARAELASGSAESEADAAESPSGGTPFDMQGWENARVEAVGPPVVVIKDPEGRVELARVYEALSKVNCDENAALLNYTPHSVTVGLNALGTVPEMKDLSAAVQAVFGKPCRVDSDGVRFSVEIGAQPRREEDVA